MRSVPEWRGATDDAAIPPRVKLRIWERYSGICACGCGIKISNKAWELDHVVPLSVGGEHRESNLHPLLTEHHKAKTRIDVAEKSRSYRRRLYGAGIRNTKRLIPGSKGSGVRKKMDGTVVRESKA